MGQLLKVPIGSNGSLEVDEVSGVLSINLAASVDLKAPALAYLMSLDAKASGIEKEALDAVIAGIQKLS